MTAYLTAVAARPRPGRPGLPPRPGLLRPRPGDLRAQHRAGRRPRAGADRDGVAQGRFREVHPALVADTVTTLMFRIGRGDTARATGLDDAAAYRELAALLLHGITL